MCVQLQCSWCTLHLYVEWYASALVKPCIYYKDTFDTLHQTPLVDFCALLGNAKYQLAILSATATPGEFVAFQHYQNRDQNLGPASN